MMLWDLMINGSNYRKCQVRFHSTISVVYTDLLQRRQMMVMNDLWTSSLQERRRKPIEKTHDTNRSKIRLHGRSKFYRLAFKGKQVVFVELFRKGTVHWNKWNKNKEFRTDLVFLFVTFFTHCWENNLRFFRINEAFNVSCKARYLSKIVVRIWRLFLLFISLCAKRLTKELLSCQGFFRVIRHSGLHTFVINRPRTGGVPS